MRITLLVACIFSFLITGAQRSDSAVIRDLSFNILNHGKAYDNLHYLCKKIGHRISGSPQAQQAVEATARMLREAGADTVYLQPVWVPYWVRGQKEQGVIHYGSQQKQLNVTALGMSVATPTNGLKAPVIEVKNFEELKALGMEKIKGKIVFFNYPMRPELIFGGYGDAVRYRTNGPVEAAKLGAVGVMIRSVTHALDNHPHTGTTRYDTAVNKIPAMACSTKDAEWLSQLLKKEKQVSLFMKINSKMMPDVLSYNVIGELRGTEKPGEIITVGGHLDSWDIGEGAHDDGTGCVQSIEVIRALKAIGVKPKRTIRAVMFMNEENGLRGGNVYADSAAAKNEHHVFAMESDAGGFGVETIGISGTAAQEAYLRQWIPVFKPYGIYDMPGGGGGADIGPLKKFKTVLSGVNPGSQRYFDHHHAPNDVFEAVNRRELELGALAMAGMAYLVSEYGIPE